MRSVICRRIRPFATPSLALMLALASAPFSSATPKPSGTPEYVLAGDFDADGIDDVLSASRGDHRFAVRYLDREGGVVRTESVPLSGALTALAVADVNRRDGLVDVLAGVGSQLLVFEGAEGAFREKAETIALPGEALEIAAGQYEGDYAIDVMVRTAAGDVVVRGRDRRLSLGEEQRAAVKKAEVLEAPEAATQAFGKQAAVFATTFVVTNVNDAGTGSLRQAILDANATPGADTITFSIHSAGVQTIAPVSDLPPINDTVTIDGTTQPGFAGTPLIELSGSNSLINGLNVRASNSVVRGLCVNRFRQHGIDVFTADNVVIEGNYVGTDPTGTQARGNAVFGVFVENSNNVRIGGTTTAARNVISANEFDNIRIASGPSTGGNLVQGNFIGTTASGTAALPDLGQFTPSGVAIFAPNSIVGGTTPAARNVISGNRGVGVAVDFFSFGQDGFNLVQGNFIGTDRTGAVDLGNGRAGVFLGYTTEVTVGGTTAAARNVISGNDGEGVRVEGNLTERNRIQGNFIGTNAAGTEAIGNFGHGVRVTGEASDTTIGGLTATPGVAPGNVISGNISTGVKIDPLPPVIPDPDPTPTGPGRRTVIQGNLIGTNAAGTAALHNDNGVFIQEGRNNTIGGTQPGARNVISGNITSGVGISEGASENVVQGNFIGTDITGSAAIANALEGVTVTSSNNTIGGTAAGARNVISGNFGAGIHIGAFIGDPVKDVAVQGNFVGLNAAGTSAMANGASGIFLEGASACTIGGTTASARNVVSGNGLAGINIAGALEDNPDSGTGNVIKGNFVGTNAAGVAGVPNLLSGIYLQRRAHANTIGGPEAGAGNVVAFNLGAGIELDAFTGNATNENLISRNSIHSNGGLGIELTNVAAGADGVTPNDLLDGDTGANLLQNFPTITLADASASSIVISGTLSSKPSSAFTVELFSSPGCDGSGNGEGKTFLGTATVTTNRAGTGSFSVTLAKRVPVGNVVTATATDAQNNTSEFSACRVVE